MTPSMRPGDAHRVTRNRVGMMRSAGDDAGAVRAVDPERWLADHGDALFGFALARVGRTEDAEDLMQEALLAAIEPARDFARRSTERTWLTGILRHKVHDYWRRRARHDAWLEAVMREVETPLPGFGASGGWQAAPSTSWSLEGTDREEFIQVLERAVRNLPESTRVVFYLSEIDQLPTSEICVILNCTKSNVWTLLHRARLRLRRELAVHWFGRDDDADPGGQA